MSEQQSVSVGIGSLGSETQQVTFCLGNEEFGFDIMSVQEIIRQPLMSRIPMAPNYVEGVTNLRGTVLPIIDTRTRFGMPRQDDTDRTRILVLDVDGTKTGLRVDCVRQVTRIQRSEFESPPAAIRGGATAQYLQGIAKLEHGKRLILSLDPRAICQVTVTDEPCGATPPTDGGLMAANAPASLQANGDQSTVQLVSFKLGQEEYAFTMDRVREILRVDRPCEVPETDRCFLGILTVRGNILPVIDLRMLLGLPTYASEIDSSACRLRDGLAKWRENAAAFAERRAGSDPGAVGPESVRTWISEFNTASQSLMDLVSRLRIANDKLMRGWAQCHEGLLTNDYKVELAREVDPYVREALALIDEFRTQIDDNIRDDQRLMVIQANGTLVALLVDRVREVLNVPTRLVDPRPPGSGGKRNEMCGVANLANGKRLIMLVDADQLIHGQTLAKVKAATVPPGAVGCERENGVPKAENQGRVAAEQQFVTFRLAAGEYGIPIAQIQEIVRASKMTHVPQSADYIDGIANLRGEVITVINARKRFQLPARAVDERTRVVILDIGGKKTGLLVDSVREVLSLSANDVAPPPVAVAGGIAQQYVSGIGKVDSGKRMLVLLDVSRVVDT